MSPKYRRYPCANVAGRLPGSAMGQDSVEVDVGVDLAVVKFEAPRRPTSNLCSGLGIGLCVSFIGVKTRGPTSTFFE